MAAFSECVRKLPIGFGEGDFSLQLPVNQNKTEESCAFIGVKRCTASETGEDDIMERD